MFYDLTGISKPSHWQISLGRETIINLELFSHEINSELFSHEINSGSAIKKKIKAHAHDQAGGFEPRWNHEQHA